MKINNDNIYHPLCVTNVKKTHKRKNENINTPEGGVIAQPNRRINATLRNESSSAYFQFSAIDFDCDVSHHKYS